MTVFMIFTKPLLQWNKCFSDISNCLILGAYIRFRTSFPIYSVVFVLLLQLKDNRTIYESYVPMKYKRYYKRMAK